MKRYLNYLIKQGFNSLPQNLRMRMIRSKFELPSLAWDDKFTLKIADTQEELEEAYKLLHNSYVGMKLMDKQLHGLRCNIYTFLPYTTTLIVKFDNEIVGTVALIKDSPMGMPSDKDYQKENDDYRRQNFKLVEVSSLAISEKFRNKGHSASLLLMKYLYNYTAYYMDSSMLVCTVHPRAEDFYKALWGFERNGEVVKYNFVKGALAIHLSLGFKDKNLFERKVDGYFKDSPRFNRGLKGFLTNKDLRFNYPTRREEQVVDPVWNPELLEYFLFEKTQAYKDFDEQSKITFLQIYRNIFDIKVLGEVFKIASDDNYREFRFPISLTAALSVDGEVVIGKLLDITSEGCFFHTDLEIPGKEIEILFRLDGRLHRVKAGIAWNNRNKENSRYPFGYGMKFDKSLAQIGALKTLWLGANSVTQEKISKTCG